MNPIDKWEKYTIETKEDLKEMIRLFEFDKPKVAGADTETDGLNIKTNKAFLIVFGWIKRDNVAGVRGRVFTFEPTPQRMNVMYELAREVKYLFFWNTKYDLHMLRNAGYEYPYENLAEGMALARVTLEARSVRDGGDSLKLKEIAKKYIYKKAGDLDTKIKQEKEKLEKQRIKHLAAALKQFPMDNVFTATGKQKFWGKGAIEEFLKDPTNDVEDLPQDVREVWEDWQQEYPPITYADIDRNLMIKYAANDVIIMLEFVRKAFPVMLHKKQIDVFDNENKTILPLYRMEQVGMKVDRNYLEESRIKVKNYIKQLRQEMYNLANGEINVGQHEKIKEIFNDKWNIILDSADKPALTKVSKHHEGEPKRYADLIIRLRTLEKWYSTYIVRILNISAYDGRAYTQIHQAAAISGRVGSDFQQFPKKPLKDEEGNELYHPRKPFIVTGNGYDKIFYLDYSQIELRVQAFYTLKVSGGDLNLCRAYMPFKCTHALTGKIFNPDDPKDIEQWNSGQWLDEKGNPWTATDVHGATTQNAFPDLDVDSEEFKVMRSSGKMVNFLKNYGGSLKAIMSQLDDIDIETAKRLDEGYYKAFPDVKKYQEMVVKVHQQKGFVQNIYGRRYYLSDNRGGYKLTNYLIQGSSADLLKEKIREVDALLLPYKSRFQMNIHDELSFEIWNGEEFLIPKIQKLMQTVSWINVPIVADIEVSTTTWADKKEIELEEVAA